MLFLYMILPVTFTSVEKLKYLKIILFKIISPGSGDLIYANIASPIAKVCKLLNSQIVLQTLV